MSKRMDGYRKAAGLDTKKRRPLRKDTLLEIVKRTFSYGRDTGIVYVSTVPLITERWRKGERQIISFMVTLPRWISEERILEAINLGFGFLEETEEQV